jgi:hypothetical protein
VDSISFHGRYYSPVVCIGKVSEVVPRKCVRFVFYDRGSFFENPSRDTIMTGINFRVEP